MPAVLEAVQKVDGAVEVKVDQQGEQEEKPWRAQLTLLEE